MNKIATCQWSCDCGSGGAVIVADTITCKECLVALLEATPVAPELGPVVTKALDAIRHTETQRVEVDRTPANRMVSHLSQMVMRALRNCPYSNKRKIVATLVRGWLQDGGDPRELEVFVSSWRDSTASPYVLFNAAKARKDTTTESPSWLVRS